MRLNGTAVFDGSTDAQEDFTPGAGSQYTLGISRGKIPIRELRSPARISSHPARLVEKEVDEENLLRLKDKLVRKHSRETRAYKRDKRRRQSR